MKVTEKEYEVIERQVDNYFCDNCGEEMGTEPEHKLSINPTIQIVDDSSYSGNSSVIDETRQVDNLLSSYGDKVTQKQDRQMVLCSSCSKETPKSVKGTKTVSGVINENRANKHNEGMSDGLGIFIAVAFSLLTIAVVVLL